MSTGSVNPTYYADFSGLEGLKKSVKADDPGALRQVARQFESLFTSMMLKSMREAKLGDGLGDSQETDLYQGMYDQQLSLQLAQGKGIGLADLLVQQLTRSGAAKPAGAAAPPGAAAAPGATTGAASSTAERTDFIKSIELYAEQAGRQLGVSADALIAQAALETGWGRHLPGQASAAGAGGPGDGASSSGGSNLYGIKAGGPWTGQTATAVTTEYQPGGAVRVPQAFRSYDSLQQGMNDYVNLLQGSTRYQGALGTGSDVTAFASALKHGGYATDPDYVQKLEATAAHVRALRATAAAAAAVAPVTHGAATDAPAAGDASLKLLAGQPTSSGGESA